MTGDFPGSIWRAMAAADLPAVAALADAIHLDHPEDAAVFAERLALFPAGCLVLDSAGIVDGYVIAHPWRLLAPPALNARLGDVAVTIPSPGRRTSENWVQETVPLLPGQPSA